MHKIEEKMREPLLSFLMHCKQDFYPNLMGSLHDAPFKVLEPRSWRKQENGDWILSGGIEYIHSKPKANKVATDENIKQACSLFKKDFSEEEIKERLAAFLKYERSHGIDVPIYLEEPTE